MSAKEQHDEKLGFASSQNKHSASRKNCFKQHSSSATFYCTRGMRKRLGRNIPPAQNILLHLSQLFVRHAAFFFFFSLSKNPKGNPKKY